MQKRSLVKIFLGTRKGGFVLSSDEDRKTWSLYGPVFKGWSVMHMILDRRDFRLHAAVASEIYGPTTHYSDDLGETWMQAGQIPAFMRPSKAGRPPGTPGEARQPEESASKPEEVLKVWNITPGRTADTDILFAGVEPAALFRSTDRGESWELFGGLYDHPHRADWFPGAGGLCLHTILLDPIRSERMYAGISTGGCYRSDNNGQTWNPHNHGLRADFLPNLFPEYGQCVHKMAIHPAKPEVIFQQNHCGVYRSEDAAASWVDIGEGHLPSRFGFPVMVHPHEPDTVYLVLEESDEYRLSVGGQFAVWRTRDAGDSWQRLTEGLPSRAHLVVLREAMAADDLESAGLYIGTSTGQLFFSRDSGDHWELIADFLPPILSVEAAVVQQ